MIIERIEAPVTFDGGEGLLGILVRNVREAPDGVIPMTTPDKHIQALSVKYRAGHDIRPHVHPRRYAPAGANRPLEVLFLVSGRVRVDFYTSDQREVTSRDMAPGDALVLCGGGHGFYFYEDSQLFEVRQGPYLVGGDKIRFEPAGKAHPCPAHGVEPAAGG